MSTKLFCDSCGVEMGLSGGNHHLDWKFNHRDVEPQFRLELSITPAFSDKKADLCEKCSVRIILAKVKAMIA